jgi:MerR family copper efflux transcriptional regulator
MRIGQLTARAGTTTKTLPFYEQSGLLPQAVRTPSGYRDHAESVLERLTFVKAAQAAGLTLSEIRDVIAARGRTRPSCEHLAEALDVYTAGLDDRIERLRALLAELQRLRKRTTTPDPPDAARLLPAAASPRRECLRANGPLRTAAASTDAYVWQSSGRSSGLPRPLAGGRQTFWPLGGRVQVLAARWAERVA